MRRPARRLPALDTRLLGQILGQVGKIGGHSDQLAKVVNATGTPPVIAAITALTAEVGAIRHALTAALRGDDAEDGR